MIRKAIPPQRDLLQSKLLVYASAPLFAFLAVAAIRRALQSGVPGRTQLALAFLISAVFAFSAWKLRAATPPAAGLGGAICLILSLCARAPGSPSPWHTGLLPLLVVFLLTFGATRLGRQRKARAGLAESRRGRNAAQVLANLGVCALACALPSLSAHPGETLHYALAAPLLAAIAALAEATADTVSSEVGQAFGGTPRMLLTLSHAPAGTDGAITLTGTLAGLAGAAILSAVAIPALALSIQQAALVWLAGAAGLFFDSLLGATLEQRGWLGNDLVNLSSTAFSGALAYGVARSVWPA